jgi:mannitol-1-/sugar-/sorbitol-6-/2-deoxyglucose-6-phosphatase
MVVASPAKKYKCLEAIMAKKGLFDAVIFDMDGLLIDSEPLWERAGAALLQSFGCTLTHSMYVSTTGLRTAEWLEHWFAHFGITHANRQAAEHEIVQAVIALIKREGKPLTGVRYIFEYFAGKGIKMAIATSSPMHLAEEVVAHLGIGHYLHHITSAEHLLFGKPHPEVYLQCAEKLQVAPVHCLCFEDSFNGLIAAKAAKMTCVVVPAASQLHQPRWAAADLKISSLQNFNDLLLQQL